MTHSTSSPASPAPALLATQLAPDSIAYVLDDDSEICALVSRMLKAAGFVAIPFTEPDLCLKQLKAADDYGKPALILLDLSLGRTDGIEVLNQLKALKYGGRVLLISGKDETALFEIEKMGVARGLAMLPPLKKPFRLDDLTKRLKSAVDTVKPPAGGPGANAPSTALERAVSADALAFRYQVRFDFKSNSVHGAEMVLYEQRASQDPALLSIASVPPNAPILVPLSRKMLRTAFADWSRHLSNCPGPIRMIVKLPLAVISTQGFFALLREVVSSLPKFPSLIVEVTDWHLFDNVKAVREASAQLKLYNVSLSTDNVSAVYSALTESFKFPFDEFRLNPNFISNCSLNETKRALCADTVKLARSVGASICAEGVMNDDELSMLAGMECDTAKGYWFGVPHPIEVFKTKILGLAMARKTDIEDPLAWPEERPNG
jgi:EAL domain-containing protein (putative c-di-GMP-specific phosphodiesterase class I)